MLPGVARGDRRTRARSRDREQVLDALSIAFSESQIGSDERERRVTAALGAGGLDELRGLISDLQLPDEHPAADLVRVPQPETPQPKGRRKALALGAAGLAGIVGLFVVAGFGSDQEPEDVRPLTAAGFERFVDDYRAEFDTTEAVQVEVMEEYVSVHVPVAGGDGRWRSYYYDDDGFTPNSGGTAPEGTATVDLVDVDADRLVENQQTALETLDVEDPEVMRVVIADDYDASLYLTLSGQDLDAEVPPHVQIFVSNEFNEQASLATDLAGTEVLQEDPFVG